MAIQTYTLSETADILKVTQRTVLNYIYRGEMKASKLGKNWRIEEEEIRTFLNSKIEDKAVTHRKSKEE